MRFRLLWFVAIIFLAISVTLFYIFGLPLPIMSTYSSYEASNVITASGEKKIILSWTKFFGIPLDDKYFDNCPEQRQNCTITVNRALYAKADVIVFHPRDLIWTDLPPSRSINQRYLFLMHESPPHTCINIDYKRNFFNWSFTYRLDSDIPYPYTYLGPISSARQDLDVKTILNKASKRASVVWLVSNCKTHSKRELYVDMLQKHMPVDVYGACGPLKCPKSVDGGYSKLSKCEDMIDKEYKFYIAFENSICTDYVTEKYYARREYNSVPIVLSRRVAEPLFPPNSFIAADDFPQGPRQLADYLKYLMKNDTAYLEFFHWKTVGYGWVGRHPKTGLQFGFCGICEKLWQLEKEGKMETKTYESADAWWGEKAACDADLVNRLVAKDLISYPKVAAAHQSPWSAKAICGW